MMLYFSLPQSPFFFFSKSWFCPVPSPCFSLFKVSFSSSSPSPVSVLSESRFRPLRVQCPSSPSSSVLSKSSPVLLKSPCPSSPIPVPVLSILCHSSQSPLPSSSSSQKRKQRNDTKPSRRSWFGVVGSKMEHSSPFPPPLPGTIQTREPRRWRSRLRHRQQERRLPHWCQG